MKRIILNTIDSTNEYAKRIAKDVNDNVLIIANKTMAIKKKLIIAEINAPQSMWIVLAKSRIWLPESSVV